jgi:peroxiredoxin
MIRLLLVAALATLSFAATPGEPAPAFELVDTDGTTHKLSDYAGKTVVLEWFNPDCPFVVYAHGPKGPLKAQPARVMGSDVVWLAVNSGAPGKQGHGIERNAKARTEYGMTYPVLIDESGDVGRAYGAKTTPHMFVIGPDGQLVFAGGIDDAPMGKGKGTNYVDKVLAEMDAGVVATTSSKAYGCSVKYGK